MKAFITTRLIDHYEQMVWAQGESPWLWANVQRSSLPSLPPLPSALPHRSCLLF